MLRKLVVLNDLTLNGVTITSIGEDTAFIKTLAFLFTPRPPDPVRHWHSFATEGWRVRVPRVYINTAAGEGSHFTIGTREVAADFGQVAFTSIDPKDDPTVPVELEATGRPAIVRLAGLPGRRLDTVFVRCTIAGGIVRFERIEGVPFNAGEDQFIRASGELATQGEGRYDLQYSARLADEELGRFIDPQSAAWAGLKGTGTAGGTMTGELDAPLFKGKSEMRLSAGVPIVKRPECIPAEIAFSFEADAKRLALDDLRADDFLSGGSAEIIFGPEPGVRASLPLHLAENSRFIPHCAGLMDRGPGLPPAPAFDVLLEAQRAGQMVNLALNSANNTSAQSRLNISGRYNFASGALESVEGSVERFPGRTLLGAAAPFLSPSFYAVFASAFTPQTVIDLRAKSSYDSDRGRQEGTAELLVERLRPAGMPLDHLSARAAVANNEVRVEEIKAEAKGIQASGRAVYGIKSKEGTAFAEVGRLQLDDIPLLASYLPGPSAASGTGRIFLNRASLKYDADVGLEVSGLPGLIRVTAAGDGGVVAARVEGGQGSFSADLKYPLPGSSDALLAASLEFRDARLDTFLPSSALGPAQTDEQKQRILIASGAVQYEADRARPLRGRGQVRVNRLRYETGGEPVLAEARPLTAVIEEGGLRFQDCALLAQGRELQLSGRLRPGTGWEAEVNGSLALSRHILPLPGIDDLSGAVDLNVRLSGPVSRPKLAGKVLLTGGEVSFPAGQSLLEVHQIEGEAAFTPEALEIRRLTGKSGQANLKGSGFVESMLDPVKRRMQINVSFRDLFLEPAENLTLTAEGLLSLQQEAQAGAKLTGNVAVRELLYEDVVRLPDLLRALTRKILGGGVETVRGVRTAGESTSGPELPLQVHIRAERGLILDTNVAQAELEADLEVLGTMKEPRLGGKIEAIEGIFGLEATKFDLITGQMLFNPSAAQPDPKLNIVGDTVLHTTGPRQTRVRISIAGTLTDPKVSFSSDAGLTEQEIVSSLGLGADLTGLQPFGRRTRQLSFRELISPASDLSLRDRLSWLTNFSEVQIETARSERTNEYVPQLVARRPVVHDFGLTIESQLAGDQASTIQVDYPLTPYLSLVSGWRSVSRTNVQQNSGNYGVGVIYRKTFPGPLLFGLSPLKEERRKR